MKRACRQVLVWIDALTAALPLLVAWCLFLAACAPHWYYTHP